MTETLLIDLFLLNVKEPVKAELGEVTELI